MTIFLVLILAAFGVGGYFLYQKFATTPSGFQKEVDALAEQVVTEGAVAPQTNTAGTEATVPKSPGAPAEPTNAPFGAESISAGTAADASPVIPSGTAKPVSRPNTTRRESPDLTGPRPPVGAGSPAAATRPPSVSFDPAVSLGHLYAPEVWEPVVSNSAQPTADRAAANDRQAEPRSGVIAWSGPLRKDALVTIDGETTNIGTVRGALPGVPVIVETDYKDVGFAEMPGPSNGWKRIALRGRKNVNVVVTLRWRTVE